MTPRDCTVAWTGILLLSSILCAEPLVYERFEGAAVGKIEGGVKFAGEVVGFGGIGLENKGSAAFDGRPGTSLNHGAAKRLTSPDFTVEAFLKLTAQTGFAAIASAWNEQGDQRSWALVVTPGRGLRFDVSPDGSFYGENVLATGPRVLRLDTWYHVAAVSQGDTSRIYVNGKEVASKKRAKPGILSDAKANLKIGNADRYATDGPRPLNGLLDEVRITPQALAPADFVKTKEAMPPAAAPGTPPQFDMPFAAKTKEEALRWQEQARATLLELVAKQQPRYSAQEIPLDLQMSDPQDKGTYTLHKVSFQGNVKPAVRYSGLLAIPKGKGPFPAMLAIHGHGGSAQAVFDPKSIYHGMADRFARGGYVVLAPSFPHRPFAAMMLWDLFRCVDILSARPEVDAQRIGVGGLSMGGEWTMWIAACDPRLKVAVVSGWMCTTEGVFSVPNCPCWELPGFVELMDVCEVNLLIAPRHVLFESAEFDGCFPIRYCKEGFARIRAGYKVVGAEEAAQQDVWPAGHEWHGAMAYPLVDKVLGGQAAKQ